jgi:hypothetical protein
MRLSRQKSATAVPARLDAEDDSFIIDTMTSLSDSTPDRAPALVDARAPRFNQALIGLLALAAFLSGFWPLVAIAALQLALTLLFGPRLCLACAFYFGLVRPRLGPGPLKDARPIRFANLVGFIFLASASVAHGVGFAGLGWALALTVAALALLAAGTGFCAGCEMYRLLSRLEGIGPQNVSHIDLDELGVTPRDGLVVQFSHPRCTDCHTLERRLASEGIPTALVDVTQKPHLARKYGIRLVPLAFRVDQQGHVLSRLTA